MTDVTDSYCERCGARYVFNPNASKTLSFKGARLLAKGLRNFVLTDGQSMADSLALARQDGNSQDSTRMTEEFHRTFNFCMTCRQYACDACWNSRVGACLSCAPEPGRKPVEPEDHLIVRTPVARWDTDWSLFPDGPAVEPVGRPDAFPRFDEPIVPPESRPARRPERSAPQVWPVADLPADVSTAATGANGKSGRRSSRKPVDAEAASLWPLADEIGPEMTLTPDELELVESRLGQGETLPDVAPNPSSLPEPGPLDAPAATRWLAANPPVLLGAAAQQPVEPRPMEPRPIERVPGLQVPPQRILRAPSAAPPQPPQAIPAPHPKASEHAPIVARLLGRKGPESRESVPDEPRRGRGRQNKLAGDPWPRVTKWSERPADAQDWWGDADATADAAAAAFAAAAAGSKVVQEPAAELILPAVASGRSPAEPESVALPAPQDARRATAPARSGRAEADARAAAAVRLSAVGTSAEQSATSTEQGPNAAAAPHAWAEIPAPSSSQPLPLDLPPADQGPRGSLGPEPPDWPEPDWPEADWQEADRDAVDAARHGPSGTPGRPAVRQPAAAASGNLTGGPSTPRTGSPGPWPPLGASWPAQVDPGAPWPGPEGAPISAVVAAQETGAHTLAEIWTQSAQEVLNRGSVRVCHRCALPVSTQARFCRRCGTRQA